MSRTGDGRREATIPRQPSTILSIPGILEGMETGSIDDAVIGGLFALAGIVMIVFRKDLEAFEERWNEALPEFLTWHRPRGRLLTVFIIVFGVLSLLGGLTVLLVNLV